MRLAEGLPAAASARRRRRAPSTVCELGAVDLHGETQARADGDAVEPHRAGAADAVLAADVRARQAERVADEVGEEQPRLDELAAAAAVDGDA